MMRIGDLAAGRAGDKGDVLDLTLVAHDDEKYRHLCRALDAGTVQELLAPVAPAPVERHELPGLRALKFVARGALPGGVFASLRAGVHWQKAAIWILLDHELPDGSPAMAGR